MDSRPGTVKLASWMSLSEQVVLWGRDPLWVTQLKRARTLHKGLQSWVTDFPICPQCQNERSDGKISQHVCCSCRQQSHKTLRRCPSPTVPCSKVLWLLTFLSHIKTKASEIPVAKPLSFCFLCGLFYRLPLIRLFVPVSFLLPLSSVCLCTYKLNGVLQRQALA